MRVYNNNIIITFMIVWLFAVFKTNISMGKHKEWRKIAKRERRRKKRTMSAIARDNPLDLNSLEYKEWLEEQEAMEIFEREQIERVNQEENEKWLKAEQIAMAQWQQLQLKRLRTLEKEIADEEKKRQEWEEEKKKVKEAQERLKQIEEEKKRAQEVFLEKLEQFLCGDSNEAPAELLVMRESKPSCDLCPFFVKTGCCRFGDECSRNHQHCGISKILLATNFYTHFGLENSQHNEYDTDVMLEYEDSDTYKDFKEFFYDVVPEFEKFGPLSNFKVCNNLEKHLRGNTYVEFSSVRSAVAAYRALHARWYGGRQMSLQFCQISSWKNAVCGLQSSRRCPKGRSCNFLHVFKNPDNRFDHYRANYNTESRRPTPRRAWRWSESPEVEINDDHSDRDKSEHKSYRRRERKRSEERKSSRSQRRRRARRSRSRSRSRSPDRRRNGH